MNRHHLPRAARGSRQSPKSRLPRVLGAKSPIRALPLPFCFFNSQLSTLNFQLLTSCRLTFHPSNVPTFKRSPVPAPIPVSELTPPASQKKSPLSFHALTWNPFCNPFVFKFMHVVGGTPLHQKKEQLMNTTTVSPTSIADPVAGPPKTEKSARAIIPSGGGTVRNMAATSDGRVYIACSGVNKVGVVERAR